MATLYKKQADTQEWVLRIEGKEDIPLLGTTSIGRDLEADICIPDDRISRKHARLLVSPEGVVVEDMGSCNGTTVNGNKVSSPIRLKSGDKIKLHVIEFSLVDVAVKLKDMLVLRANGREDIPLKDKLRVGRDPSCGLRIDDPRISREHASVSISPSGVVLGDLNSINGTYVNGIKIERPTIISIGDKVRFHDNEFFVAKAVDPDATRICRSEAEIDSTRFDKVFVSGEALAASKERDEPIVVAAQKQHEAFRPNDYLTEDARPSAIERQMNGRSDAAPKKLDDIKLGTWFEFSNGYGKTKHYCLISNGEPEHETYSFAKQSGWGLVKKSREQMESGLLDGSIRVLERSAMKEKTPIFFGGRLSRFF